MNPRASGLHWLRLLTPVVAVALAFVTVAIGLQLAGADPVHAFERMASAALGSPFALSTTVVKTLPRLVAALGIALALRAGLWNIGAEGQLYVGAIAATGAALFLPRFPFPLLLLAGMFASMVAGGLYAALPGVLRARRGVSEVITSLMLVYVAIQLTNYLVEGPWLLPGTTFPASPIVPPESRLPLLVPHTLLNAGAVVAILAVALTWIMMARSTFGLQLRAVGGNERAARASGVPVARTIVLAMVASGAMAGLAGGIEVLGTRGRLIEGFSVGYGFEAIAIALLGRLQPLGITLAALLFGALDAAGAGLQTASSGVPSAIVQITSALAVVYVLVGLGLIQRADRRRSAREAIAAAHAMPVARGATVPSGDGGAG